MRILVTGSEGFIGSHLVSELRAYGHDVCGVDLRRGLGSVEADLTEPGVARHVISAIQPEIVVHLAAQVGRLFGERDVGHTIQSNAEMIAYVAQACSEENARLCYVSTSEVYGDQADAVCDEYAGPFGLPHNLYGLSKRWGEEVSKLYAPNGLLIVRPSMPYGTGVPPGQGRAAINNVLWQAETRQIIPIHMGASRSWCWIGDVVAGFRLILEKGQGVYNLGRDDDEVSMLKVADMAVAMTGAPSDLIKMIPAPKAQTVVKRLSTGRLRHLGWEPKVSLEEGMVYVWDWVRHFDKDGQWVEEAA